MRPHVDAGRQPRPRFRGRASALVVIVCLLAACATLIPSVQSIYRWEGKIEDSKETLLLIKTGVDQLAALEARFHALHSYQTPEFLVIEAATGSAGYLAWMLASLGQAEGR